MRRTATLGVGGVAAAGLSALCCLGMPVLLGLGLGAGLIAVITPLRPLFGILMIVFLGLAFYRLYMGGEREPGAVGPGGRKTSRERLLFWVATLTAIALWALPSLLPLISGGASHP